MNTKPCRRNREPISLLAAGVLPEAEHARLESHLASCAACRNYFWEMRSLGQNIGALGDGLAAVEPTAAMRARWAREIHAVGRVGASRWALSPQSILAWWRELRAAQRAGFTGLIAAWAMILFFNLSAPGIAEPAGTRVAISPRELFVALKAQAWTWSQRVESSEPSPAERPKPAVPRPRSDRRVDAPTV
ncbi:MAG: zf-HC2 domain-containing protein [Limisphaerales bacterium]